MKNLLPFITAVTLVNGACAEDTQKGSNLIPLPKPKLESNISVEEALQGRRSIRSYKNEPLSLSEISQLLWAAYGVTQKMSGFRGGLKTAPSAGATYPLEIYLVVGNVKGLTKGIYQYKPEGHTLKKVYTGDKRAELCAAAHGQSMVRNAPASIVYTAIFERTTGRYGGRGRDRYVCMDLGHSAQNVYLQAFTLNIGTCAVGAQEFGSETPRFYVNRSIFPENYPEFLKLGYTLLRQAEELRRLDDKDREAFQKSQSRGVQQFFRLSLQAP